MELGYRGDLTVRETRLRSLFFLPAALPRATMAWQPQVDIYRSGDGWVIKLELAGVRPQDVSITMHGSQLRVEGVRHDWIIEQGWSHHTMEIAYNRFERTIDLPCDLAHARITVECRDGMLLLRVAVSGGH
jgi:HSP20 family protein